MIATTMIIEESEQADVVVVVDDCWKRQQMESCDGSVRLNLSALISEGSSLQAVVLCC